MAILPYRIMLSDLRRPSDREISRKATLDEARSIVRKLNAKAMANAHGYVPLYYVGCNTAISGTMFRAGDVLKIDTRLPTFSRIEKNRQRFKKLQRRPAHCGI